MLGILVGVALAAGAVAWSGSLLGAFGALGIAGFLVGALSLGRAVLYQRNRAPAGWGGGLAISIDQAGIRAQPQGFSPPEASMWTWDEIVDQRRAGSHRIVTTADGTQLVLPGRRVGGTRVAELLDQKLGA